MMNQSKICPDCGTPQQWKMWRHCACGYDFGPGEIPAGAEAPPASKQEPEEDPSDWLTEERFGRFFRGVGIGIVIAFLLTHFIYPMDWLTKATAFVLFVTCWEPSWLWKRKS